MKNLVAYLLSVFAVVALFGFAFSFAQEEAPDGKQVFIDSKCTMCHSIEALEIKSKKKEPVDLSEVGDDLNAEFITKFLKKEETLDGKKHMMPFKGTDEELNALADFLAGLQSEKAEVPAEEVEQSEE